MRFKKQIGVLLIIAVTYSILEILRRQNQFRSDFEVNRLYINIGVILSVVVIFVVVKAVIRKQFDIPIKNKMKRFKWYDKLAFIIAILMIKDFLEFWAIQFSKYVLNMNSDNVSKNQEIANADLKNHPLWYSVFDGSITAPIVEEIMFRGVFYLLIFSLFATWNKGKRNILVIIMFIVVSSTYFGYRHVAAAKDYQYILPYIASGVAFSIAFIITKSVLYSASVHAISNLLVTLDNAQAYGVSSTSGFISGTISFVLFVYIIIYISTKIIKHRKKIYAKYKQVDAMEGREILKLMYRKITT